MKQVGPPDRRVRTGLNWRDISDDVWPSKLTLVGLVVLVLVVPAVVMALRHWIWL